MDKKTILAFPFALLLGSTHPVVAVAKELKEKGYRVIFASSGKFMDYVREEGFETEEIIDFDNEWFTSHVNKGSMGYHDSETLQKFVDEELKLIDKYKPDLLLDIHRPSLKVSSALTGVKKASIVDVVFTKYYAGRKSIPETHWLHFLNRNKFLKKIGNSIRKPAEDIYFKKWAKPYNRLLKSNNLPKLQSLKDTFEGDLTIFMDAKEFTPVTAINNANIHFVGPVLHTLNTKLPDWYERLDPNKKTIFLSMGSSGILFPKILEYLVKMFRGTKDIQVVATTAMNHEIPDMDYPENFFITDYIPADFILKNNCILVITHGGRGSLYHALKYGVPIIGIPHQAEQEWNLERVEEMGLGILLHSKNIDFKALSDAISKIMEDKGYKKEAEAFAEILKVYNGEKEAAQIIEDFLDVKLIT